MNKRLLPLMFLIIFSCSSTPKGEYSQSKIERPYALPDDIASFEVGYSVRASKAVDFSEDDKVEDENQAASFPLIGFEQGISKSVSWIYPIGLKWNIYNNDKHTFGTTASSLFFYSSLSLDYWYRLTENLSIRPYFKNEKVSLILINEARDVFGAEALYQLTSKLSLSLNYDKGAYRAASPFLDAIMEDISGREKENVRIHGLVSRVGLNAQYSFSENWDFLSTFAIEQIEFDDFTNQASKLNLSFVYFY